MYKVYDRWPEIAEESYYSKLDTIDYKGIDHIVFAGMGGSGALGDIFSAILSNTKLHVVVTKGYHLPTTVDRSTLVVTTSVSGNTIETLSVLEAARRSVCKTIAFSSSGKMEQYCSRYKIEYRKMPHFHSPRASFTGFLYGMLKVLCPILPIKERDILNSIRELKKQEEKITSLNLTDRNPSLTLASWISGIPLIYYPFGLQAAAIRFKNSLQENAKIHSMAEDVVEACHNGIVSWERISDVQPILIQGEDDYEKTKKTWTVLKKYLKRNKVDYREVHSIKGSILSKLINLIYLLDYSTIYLAALSGVDPTPIKSVEYFKRELA